MSAGDKSIYLKAGQIGLPVRAGGDFIFLKESARPVRVIVDGQPITMRAGDKRVVLRKEPGRQAFDSFDVDNLSESDLRVLFVVGDGDYNSQIVHGEMNVSAYIATSGRGVANSLPMKVDRVVGVESEDTVALVRDIELSRSQDVGVYGTCFCVWFIDRFYVFASGGKWFSFKKNTPTGAVHEHGTWSAAGQFYKGATITPEGVIFYRTDNALYKMHIGSPSPVSVALESPAEWLISGSEKDGLHYWRGRIYARSSASGNGIVSIDVNGGDFRVHRTDVGDAGRMVGLRDRLYLMGTTIGTHFYDVQDDFSVKDAPGSDEFVTATVRGGALDDSGLYCFDYGLSYGANAGYIFKGFRTVSLFGQLYIHPVGDVDRKEIINLFSPLKAYDSKSGRVVVHDWLPAILKGLGGGANYRDYLTGYSYDSGVVAKEVSSGTQTFSYRGIEVEEFPALDGSTVTINILPDYF